MSENHDQLLIIVNVCIQNGNGTASINGVTLSGRGRMERKCHHFFDILDTYVKILPKHLVKDVHQMIKVVFLCKPNTVNTRAVTCKSAQWPHL